VNKAATITTRPLAVMSLHDALIRMDLWANELPGWCTQKEPIARSLQASLGIRLIDELIEREDFLTARAFRDFRRKTRRRYRQALVKSPRLIAAVDDFEEPDRRFRYRPRRIVTQQDLDAARLVVTRAVTVLALAVIRKKRWRAKIGDNFLTDWTILKHILASSAPNRFDSWGNPSNWAHPSFRGLAAELGFDEKAIRKRFDGAIEAIKDAIGPVESLSPQPRTYSRRPRQRTARRPQWRDQLHVHVDRPSFQTRRQVLASELDLVARFVADGGVVQKLPPGLAVDFGGFLTHQSGQVTNVKRCATYGAGGELLWVVSSRPQPAWDNVRGVARRVDADLDVPNKWQGKAHVDFEKKYRRGQQWVNAWQSRPTHRFAVKFYNAGEDGLLPGRLNGAEIRGRPNRDCTGPEWEYQGIFVVMREPPRQREVYAPGWDDGPIPKRSTEAGFESSDVRNDSVDLMARWAPPSSYFNLTPEEMNTPFFE
jgi:hypothetical protein